MCIRDSVRTVSFRDCASSIISRILAFSNRSFTILTSRLHTGGNEKGLLGENEREKEIEREKWRRDSGKRDGRDREKEKPNKYSGGRKHAARPICMTSGPLHQQSTRTHQVSLALVVYLDIHVYMYYA
eukprot:1163144-Amorphochlora_amoeboformis.AAC.2